MNTDYISKLNDMYNDIYANSGRCTCFSQCKANNAFIKFCSDRVKIGTLYGENYPKILFAGLEGVCDGPDYQIPEISTESTPSLDATNEHYRGVRYVLSYILSEFDHIPKPLSAKIGDLNKPEYNNHLQYYCLTNIYKCAFALRRSKLPHTTSMKNNCPSIFIREIELLRPDIVVIQAKTDVPTQLWESMCNKFGNSAEPQRIDSGEGYTSCYKMYYQDLKPFYALWTYHGKGFPFAKSRGGIFVNNTEYISAHLNPVLDALIQHMNNTFNK